VPPGAIRGTLQRREHHKRQEHERERPGVEQREEHQGPDRERDKADDQYTSPPQRSDIAATQPATISQITEAARIAQMTAFLFRCRILVVYDKEYVMTMYPIAFGATNVPAARITWRQLVRSTSATGVRLSFCAASALRN